MDADFVATFFALLLLGGVAGTTAAWLVPSLRSEVSPSVLPIAAVVAVGAMAGSLWFSESAGFVPCELCWYQRIAMYPLALLLTVGAHRRDDGIRPYAILLAVIGGVVSLYHVQIQLFPEQSSFCEVSNPCSAEWVEAFGWMTIPQMAGLSFSLIVALLLLPRFADRRSPLPQPPTSEHS